MCLFLAPDAPPMDRVHGKSRDRCDDWRKKKVVAVISDAHQEMRISVMLESQSMLLSEDEASRSRRSELGSQICITV